MQPCRHMNDSKHSEIIAVYRQQTMVTGPDGLLRDPVIQVAWDLTYTMPKTVSIHEMSELVDAVRQAYLKRIETGSYDVAEIMRSYAYKYKYEYKTYL